MRHPTCCSPAPDPQFAEAQESSGREAVAETTRRLRSMEARLEALEAEAPGRETAWEAKLRAGESRPAGAEYAWWRCIKMLGGWWAMCSGRCWDLARQASVGSMLEQATAAGNVGVLLACQARSRPAGALSRQQIPLPMQSAAGLIQCRMDEATGPPRGQPVKPPLLLPTCCSDGTGGCQAGAGGGGR